MLHRLLKLAAVWLLFASVTVATPAQESSSKKLQIYILAGQSNMVGHANYITIPRLFTDEDPQIRELARFVFKPDTTVTREAVDALIATRIERDSLASQLRKNEIEGEQAIAAAQLELETLKAACLSQEQAIKDTFAVSDRVYISSIADGHRRSGPLTVGYGGSADKIGPELGFGMSMAQRTDAPILIIKTSWGGKSLHYNFRPPSAGPYELSEEEAKSEDPAKIGEDAGLNYRMMIESVRTVLANVADHHPAYDSEAGYEISGFVWFQGFNDQFSDPFRDNYKQNMIAFIKDVRSEFSTPDMPFVIGVLGTGVTAEEVGKNAVSLGQRAAAAEPEFKGNVAKVESYELYDLGALEVFNKGWQNHFAEWSAVGSDRPYHYLGSGKFFVRLGDAFASAMSDLQKAKQP